MYEEYIRRVLDSRNPTLTHELVHLLSYTPYELPILLGARLGLPPIHKHIVNLC
jgi:hypothetical protein